MSAPSQAPDLSRDLAAIVGERRVSTDWTERMVYARDMWPRLLFAVRAGDRLPHQPHAVVWPENPREVAAIVRYARERQVAIVPYGGGSGVCGAAVPVRGGITIDLKRMDRLESIHREEMICDVQAGANGERFERELQSRGYTLGHFPSSIYCSTVGGWLACRAAGQLSTKYGKIEDRVVGMTVVTGRGEIIETDELARASRGPNWNQLIVGSEGTLGVITSARLRVAPAPEILILRGFEFPDIGSGVEAIRRVMQRGLRPAVVRLYNEVDTFFNHVSVFKGDKGEESDEGLAPTAPRGGGALPRLPARKSQPGGIGRRLLRALGGSEGTAGLRRGVLGAALDNASLVNDIASGLAGRVVRRGCRMIIGLEGPRIRTEIESKLVFSELGHAGGTDMGEEPGREWLEHRYSVSYKMSKVFRDGAFADTMEVAATWDRLMDLYYAVNDAIGKHAVVMAHFSHAYPDGCSIYFSFAGKGDTRKESEEVYDAIWRDGMAAASRAGGTISHHHGVGLLRSPYMHAEHREAMTLLRAVKTSLDPDNIMNPGKLGLAATPGGEP